MGPNIEKSQNKYTKNPSSVKNTGYKKKHCKIKIKNKYALEMKTGQKFSNKVHIRATQKNSCH